jgi:DNA-binding IclR family transcriptional regulator
MSQTVGRIIPPHASSLGKAITAFQPEAVQERLPRTESSRKSEFRGIRLRETTI